MQYTLAYIYNNNNKLYLYTSTRSLSQPDDLKEESMLQDGLSTPSEQHSVKEVLENNTSSLTKGAPALDGGNRSEVSNNSDQKDDSLTSKDTNEGTNRQESSIDSKTSHESSSNTNRLNTNETSRSNNDNNSDKSTNVISGSVVSDKIITSDMMNSLMIFTGVSDVEDYVVQNFSFQKFKNAKRVIPDSDFSHFKIPEDSEFAKLSSHLIDRNWYNWEFIQSTLFNNCYEQGLKFSPVDRNHLHHLGRYVAHSEKISGDPVWSLSPIRQYFIADVMYGVANGASDLLYFVPSEHESLIFRYDFSVTSASSEGKDKNKISITLNGGMLSSSEYSVDVYDKLYNTDTVRSMFRTQDINSIYFRNRSRNNFNRMYGFSTKHDEITFSQNQTTTRIATIVKSHAGDKQYGDVMDGFQMRVIVNDNFRVSQIDKGMMDMIVSLFHIKRFIDNSSKSEKETVTTVLNYVGTTLQKYIVDQVAIKAGVTIHTIKIEVNVQKRKDAVTSEQLKSMFKTMVENGDIVLMSPLHYLWYFGSCDDYIYQNDWEDYIIGSSLANPYINESLSMLLPTISRSDKNDIASIARNKEFLKSDFYINRVAAPDKSKANIIEISFRDFMKELFVRTISKDQIPDCIPVFSKGGWSFGNIRSYNIKLCSLHSLNKFTMINLENNIEAINNIFILDPSKIKIPPYIKGASMLTGQEPKIFNMVVPTYGDD